MNSSRRISYVGNNTVAKWLFSYAVFLKTQVKLLLLLKLFYQTALTLMGKEIFGNDHNREIPGFGLLGAQNYWRRKSLPYDLTNKTF